MLTLLVTTVALTNASEVSCPSTNLAVGSDLEDPYAVDSISGSKPQNKHWVFFNKTWRGFFEFWGGLSLLWLFLKL